MEAAILEAGESCVLEPEEVFDLLAVYVGEDASAFQNIW